MPAYTKPQNPTPWAKVLLDYMWNQRPPQEPPLSNGQLAIRLNISRVTVNHWIYNRVIPNLETAIDVLQRLDIPVERLIRAYEDEGVPTPPITETPERHHLLQLQQPPQEQTTHPQPQPQPDNTPSSTSSSSSTRTRGRRSSPRYQRSAAARNEPPVGDPRRQLITPEDQ